MPREVVGMEKGLRGTLVVVDEDHEDRRMDITYE